MVDTIGKPRLLVVTSTYPRWSGDTEPTFVHQLASRLTNRFDVVVSTSRAPGTKPSEIMDGVQVYR
jgi:tRNA A37 threonylcarbamoyladenosine synthetase subunit TsaC/SUA5/YrdC